MSILIKGMEMPECCEECPCYDWKEDFCRITETVNDFSDKRVSDCPLVEVPTPHGRLIDADAYIDKHEECGWLDDITVDEFNAITPTIIEAEVNDNA